MAHNPQSAIRNPKSALNQAAYCFALALALLAWPLQTSAVEPFDTAREWDDEVLLLQAMGASALLSAPVWAPFIAFDQGPEASFSDYPYEDFDDGYMHFANETIVGKPIAGTFLAEVGMDGHVSRQTTQLTLDTQWRVGLDAELSFFDGPYKQKSLHGVNTGDLNALLRFAQHGNVQFRAGAGMRWLDDDRGTDYGLNLTYGVDAQVYKPFIGSLSVDWTYLRDEQFLHGRLSLGAIWRRWEAYAAYDYLHIDGAYIAGPAAGVRVWF